MKNIIEKIKKNAGKESKKALYVVLGFASGTVIAKGMDWVATKYPQFEPIVKFGKPVLLAGGGWLITVASEDKNELAKYIGYGLQTSAAFEGAKLLPIVKDFLGGVDLGIGTSYYMENEKPFLELGNFGINSLPLSSLNMESAPSIRLELPNLDDMQGTEDDLLSGLGYNSEKFDGII